MLRSIRFLFGLLLLFNPSSASATSLVELPKDFPGYQGLITFTSEFRNSVASEDTSFLAKLILGRDNKKLSALNSDLEMYFFKGTTRPPEKDIWNGVPLKTFFSKTEIKFVLLSEPIRESPYRTIPYFYQPRSFLACWYDSQRISFDKAFVVPIDGYALEQLEKKSPQKVWCVYVHRTQETSRSIVYKDIFVRDEDLIDKIYGFEP